MSFASGAKLTHLPLQNYICWLLLPAPGLTAFRDRSSKSLGPSERAERQSTELT